ncbi:hypothetical protein Tsubulata_027268 [Turnera subulata]|uniref:Leucine-rich repeat-containing N-terminal plant-type domain-containing protein n=1 Tax=Turnera subulata TaxID=218843 RepID=A0A9Q0JGT6_9ROSI|nr:hypothetical protein Tsubulata_027268 [Turnera subulata]
MQWGRFTCLFFVSMLSMFLAKKCISISTRNNITDQEALLALKAAITYDPENILARNWSTNASFCNWVGITSSNRGQRVTELNISGMGLVGAIPPQLGNLSFLRLIDVKGNQFHGYIPPELANLRRMEYLLFSSNNFTGHIPESIFNMTSIQNIDFSFNSLSGTIPSNVENVPNLQHLMLQYSNLTGHIPASVFNISTLLWLQQLYLCKASSLIELYLRRNRLSGALPDCIGLLTSLRILALDANALSSPIPMSLWGLKDLLTLMLSFSSFNGSLPLQVGQMVALTQLNLSGNHFFGNIPSTLGQLKDLSTLFLCNKRFQGAIPESLGKLKGLEMLDLSSNNLSGNIPKSLEELESLVYFNVSFNALEGEIPSGGRFIYFTARSFTSNKALCRPPRLQVPPCSSDSHHHSRTTKSILLRFVLPPVAYVVLIVAFILLLIHQRRQRIIPNGGALPFANQRRISYLELMKVFGLKFFCHISYALLIMQCNSCLAEYGLDGVVSTKIDVYSFGIMLMETFTRRKPTDDLFDGGVSFTSWVKASLPSSTMNIVDSNMLIGENRNFVNVEKCLISFFDSNRLTLLNKRVI